MAKMLNLEVANVSTQTVATDSLFNLGNVVRKYCCACNNTPTFTFTNGSNTITLNQPGYYMIDVNTTFSGGTAGNAAVALYSNGAEVPQASGVETITTASTELRNIAFSTTIRVLPNAPVSITIVNTGAISLAASNIDVNILKVC